MIENSSSSPISFGDVLIKPDDIPRDVIYHAYLNVSHVPEDWVPDIQKRYMSTMEDVILKLKQYLKQVNDDPAIKDLMEMEFNKFKRKFQDQYISALETHTRIASTAIVGPGNFGKFKNRISKAERSYQNKMEVLASMPETFLKSIRRKISMHYSTNEIDRMFDISLSTSSGSINATVIFHVGIDRLLIKFDKKPPIDVIAQLKRNAFRWSKKNNAWQRHLTNPSYQSLKFLLQEFGVELPEFDPVYFKSIRKKQVKVK